MMMCMGLQNYCGNCGKRLSLNEEYCRNCGARTAFTDNEDDYMLHFQFMTSDFLIWI